MIRIQPPLSPRYIGHKIAAPPTRALLVAAHFEARTAGAISLTVLQQTAIGLG